MDMYFNMKSDIGNNKVKFKIGDKVEKVQSVYKRLFVPIVPSEASIEKCVTNLLNELSVNITSSSIKRSGQFLVGERAMNFGKDVKSMDISEGGKYVDDLPLIHTISIIAAKAIQNAFADSKELSETLNVTVDLITAIPASEWTPERARILRDRFLNKQKKTDETQVETKNGAHIAIVDVAETKVSVTIKFNDVKVTREGIPPLYLMLKAIREKKLKMFEKYVDFCEKELKYTKEKIVSLITEEVFSRKKILHIDIGDGTTEYIYTDGVNPKSDACTGEKRGVGHAIIEAIKLLQSHKSGVGDLTRQQFSEILKNQNHKFYDEATSFFAETRFVQAENILQDIKNKYRDNTASEAEIIAVYGGGSIGFEEDLYEELSHFCVRNGLELLWIPEEYAIDMNIEGMDVLANEVLAR
ncbi:ParM/StbA family protein [Bacillus pseudomycoides]|uniref:ParM/StbA family protein n=1 Tax=Bacillus pseudomycoides TaxID=64104 RepID=UPI00215AD2AA|nr:ParM/StbA family protein [Bacillus pseudomycoides]MCR8860420.1 ParM/StbA family protein [Bacillus pseudomycoides]